jgi:hypothetical protein
MIHLRQLASKPLQKINSFIELELVSAKKTPEFIRVIPKATT